MKVIKILQTALRILAAVPCALVLWAVYFIVGMFEALICGVLRIVWGIVLFVVSLSRHRSFRMDINALIRIDYILFILFLLRRGGGDLPPTDRHDSSRQQRDRTAARYRESANQSPLDDYFVYGFGAHHFWVHQRKVSDPTQQFRNRLLKAEF